MKFPVTIRDTAPARRKSTAPGGKFAYYRLGSIKPQANVGCKLSPTIRTPKPLPKRIVRELANGSQAAALNATQSRDALAAIERLQGFYQASGHRVSLLTAVSDYVEAAGKLHGRSLNEAVKGYLRSGNQREAQSYIARSG